MRWRGSFCPKIAIHTFLRENNIQMSLSEWSLLISWEIIFFFLFFPPSQSPPSPSYAVLSEMPRLVPKLEQKITSLQHFAGLINSPREQSSGAPVCHSCSSSRSCARITALQHLEIPTLLELVPKLIMQTRAYCVPRAQKTFFPEDIFSVASLLWQLAEVRHGSFQGRSSVSWRSSTCGVEEAEVPSQASFPNELTGVPQQCACNSQRASDLRPTFTDFSSSDMWAIYIS